MTSPATLTWFAAHELRLSWRDWLSMMTAGRRWRVRNVAVALVGFGVFMHLLAYAMVAQFAEVADPVDTATLLMITGSALLSWSLMVSQAMESVTRAFYARSDLDLILSSPAAARKLFAVRIATMALSIICMAVLLSAPFINVLALRGGARWLGAYGVAAALGATAAAFAVALTVALFRTIGPRRTRLIAQIVAAVIGAAFVIGLQVAAIVSYGTLSRTVFLRSDSIVALAPDLDSPLWWPARAMLGDGAALAAVLAAGALALAAAIALFSGRFGEHAVAAQGVAHGGTRQRRLAGFRRASPRRALRHKEWTLLRRDPWLVSQTLMQLLYLLPPALLLWKSFGEGAGGLVLLVPVLVMASGAARGRARLARDLGRGRARPGRHRAGAAARRRARQDRGGDGRRPAGLLPLRDRAPAHLAVLRRRRGAGHRGGGRIGDRDPALVPGAGPAQPFPPPPDLVAHGDLRGSLCVDRLGGDRGARRRRHVARVVPGILRARRARRREMDEPEKIVECAKARNAPCPRLPRHAPRKRSIQYSVSMHWRLGASSETAVITGLPAFAGNDGRNVGCVTSPESPATTDRASCRPRSAACWCRRKCSPDGPAGWCG